jgi:transcriptional regulator with XRE-family HTH domain
MSTTMNAEIAPLEDESREATLGAKLRMRRKRRGLGLQEVAAASGVSIGQLSQIERDLSQPSLRSLRQICTALDMPIGWLFDDPAPHRPEDAGLIVRAGRGRTIDLGAKGMVKELLTPDGCEGVQMMRIAIKPGGASGEAPYLTRGGARCATVLSGRLAIEVDGRAHSLGPGDSFAFEAERALLFRCEGDEPCELIWAVAPAIY